MIRWPWIILAVLVAAGLTVLLYPRVVPPPDPPEVDCESDCPEQPCPVCPTAEDVEAVIELTDEHSAAWMPIDNAFSRPATSSGKWKYIGLLFQFGEFERGLAANPNAKNKFTRLSIEHEAGTTFLDAGQFTWVNVVPSGYTAAAIHSRYSYLLYPEKSADAANPYTVCRTLDDTLAGAERSCLRVRQIRARSEIHSIMTYWTDNGYTVNAGYGRGGRHGTYTFNLLDEVTAYVWTEQGIADKNPQILTGVTKIIIREPTGHTHGETHAAPIGDPGSGLPSMEPLP